MARALVLVWSVLLLVGIEQARLAAQAVNWIAYGRRRRRQVVVAPTCAAPAAAGSECRPRRGSVRASWRRTHAARRRLLARREMVSVVLVWGMGSV